MLLDSEGRLVQFQAWPEESAGAGAPDVARVVSAAGLDPGRLKPAEPSWTPLSTFDSRLAWTGVEGPYALQIQASFWKGQLVDLERRLPWKVTAPVTDSTFANFYLVFLPIVAAVVAWRNLRLGRGDRRGATRLAAFLLICNLIADLCSANHVPTAAEGRVLYVAIRDSLKGPIDLWLVYIAFEPYLRRYVPHTLIGWRRFLDGRWSDPLVGGNLLAGVAIGIGAVLAGFVSPPPSGAQMSLPVAAAGSVAWLALMTISGIAAALFLTLLWLLVRIPTGRDWLASVLFCVVAMAVSAPQFVTAGWQGFLYPVILIAIVATVIVRLGVLATVALLFAWYAALAGGAPWTTNLSVWYARTALMAIAAILAVALYGFRTTLAGRPLWKDELTLEAR